MSQESSLLSPREREIARLRVAGLSQTDIAKRLGINRCTVMRALERDIVRGHITHLHDALDAELVRAMVYNPFVELLAQAAAPRRGRRRRSL